MPNIINNTTMERRSYVSLFSSLSDRFSESNLFPIQGKNEAYIFLL